MWSLSNRNNFMAPPVIPNSVQILAPTLTQQRTGYLSTIHRVFSHITAAMPSTSNIHQYYELPITGNIPSSLSYLID